MVLLGAGRRSPGKNHGTVNPTGAEPYPDHLSPGAPGDTPKKLLVAARATLEGVDSFRRYLLSLTRLPVRGMHCVYSRGRDIRPKRGAYQQQRPTAKGVIVTAGVRQSGWIGTFSSKKWTASRTFMTLPEAPMNELNLLYVGGRFGMAAKKTRVVDGPSPNSLDITPPAQPLPLTTLFDPHGCDCHCHCHASVVS